MTRQELEKNFTDFMTSIEQKLSALEISLTDYPIDHLCYRTETQQEYLEVLDFLATQSVLQVKKVFRNRNFNTFVLRKPLEYKGLQLSNIEYSEPGGGDEYSSGFQHFEFLTTKEAGELSSSPELKNVIHTSETSGEKYLKWEDRMVVKLTSTSLLNKMLSEEDGITGEVVSL